MQISIQDAMKKLFAVEKWDSKMAGLRIAQDWEKIMGKTIQKYTQYISLKQKTLFVKTEIPILKHELITNKTQLIAKINAFYEAKVVEDIKVN